MAVIGSLPTVNAQLAVTPGLRLALDYVGECFREGGAPRARLLAAELGHNARVELGQGVFALEQVYQTKPRADGRWETHRAHIDVQALIAGEEFMEVADRAKLTLHEDLTPGQDVIFYRSFDRGCVLRFGAGDIGVYFPSDGHMGSLAVGQPGLVRKVVVKVPVAAP